MAEALRSAIGIRERPASSYYDLSGRAEGQPTLNRQEEGGEAVANQAEPQRGRPPRRPLLRRVTGEIPSRPSSPEDAFFRHLEHLTAEDALGAYQPNNNHIPINNQVPAEAQQQAIPLEDVPLVNNLFQPPPLPPPPIAVQPPQNASVMFYGLEHRADSYHNGNTGLEFGVGNVNGQLTLDIDRDVGTLRRYAVGVRDASVDFHLSYSSHSNGNLIQRRPAATQANKPEAILLQYESAGQSKRRDAAHCGLVATNFFHVFTVGLAVLVLMLWLFPITGAVPMAAVDRYVNSDPFILPNLQPSIDPLPQSDPQFEKEDPVIFIHEGVIYPYSQIVGARIDIDTTSVVHFGQAAVSLGNYLVQQPEFKNISQHSSIAGHAASVLKTKLEIVQAKTNDAATSLKVSQMWQPKEGHLKSPKVSSALRAKLAMSQATLTVIPQRQQQQAQHKAKRSIWDMVTGVFDSFIDGVLSVFHLTSNRHMEASLQNLEYHEKKMNGKFIQFERNITRALETIAYRGLNFDRFSATLHLLTLVLDEAENEIDQLSANINGIVRGELSSYVLSTAECVTVHEKVVKAAAAMGLESVYTNPLQLLSAQASTFATNTSLIVVLHIHLVDPKAKFQAYTILTLPFLAGDSSAHQFDIKAKTIAVQPGLASKAKHMLISERQEKELCSKFAQIMVCHVPVRTHQSCPMSLFRHQDHQCHTKPVVSISSQRFWNVGPKMYMFFNVPTSVYLKCPQANKQSTEKGLVSLYNHFGCEVSTEMMVLHPLDNVELEVVESPRRPAITVNPKALEKAIEDIDNAPANSLDNLVDGLEEGINKTSKYHTKWSPQTPGTHDYVHGGLSLLAWTIGAVVIAVFLWVAHKRGKTMLAAQPGPVHFVAAPQEVILPPANQMVGAAIPAAAPVAPAAPAA